MMKWDTHLITKMKKTFGHDYIDQYFTHIDQNQVGVVLKADNQQVGVVLKTDNQQVGVVLKADNHQVRLFKN